MATQLVEGDRHDAALAREVRPTVDANPRARKRYDLVVLGGGPAGLVAAVGAAGLGAQVALVERDLLGGDCLNAGCVPSKALLASARAVRAVREASAFGVQVGETRVDFSTVAERMRRLRASLAPHDSAARLRGLGIDLFAGEGRFASTDVVEVAGQSIRFRKAFVATGSRPKLPETPGLAEAGFLTNESLFSLEQLPGRLAVVGAGPIGCEMAQAFARFGASVTLFAKGPEILPREDADAAAVVRAALVRDGVNVVFATPAQVRPDRTLETADGRAWPADAILVATGRTPNVESLALERAGIAFRAGVGVSVDDRLRTTNRRVYAVGDVVDGPRFTHAADAQARLAIRNALFWGRGRASRLVVPHCTYTDPELAHVGLTLAEARARDIPCVELRHDFANLDRAVLDGDDVGFAQALIAPSGRLLGATIVGAHAGDLLAPLTAAVARGEDLGALSDVVFPYPTRSEIAKKLADARQRLRLTARAKRWLGRWLAWGR